MDAREKFQPRSVEPRRLRLLRTCRHAYGSPVSGVYKFDVGLNQTTAAHAERKDGGRATLVLMMLATIKSTLFFRSSP